jgi:rod shape-determining protein MreC
MGEASRVRAVLAGQATRRPELITQPFQMQAPRLDFVVGAENLREGERVITSGDGGLFPRGIPVGVARGERDGSWRVALSAAQRPIDFVRLIPYMGVSLPENAPVADEGPPLNTPASVAAIGRQTMPPPPPGGPSAIQQAPRPRREQQVQAEAPQPSAEPAAPSEQPAPPPTPEVTEPPL